MRIYLGLGGRRVRASLVGADRIQLVPIATGVVQLQLGAPEVAALADGRHP
jgi:hypothetical protein